MTTLNLKWIPSLLVLSVLVTACQGQNPFKRESNPVKDYAAVTENTVPVRAPGERAEIPPAPPAPDNDQFSCFEPMKITVDSDKGNKLMTFTEDSETTYRINVVSMLDETNFDVKASQLPEGASFRPLQRRNNTAVFSLTWKPGKGRGNQVQIELLTLKYESEFSRQKCGSNISERLNLIVLKTDDLPTLSFVGLPQTAIKFGENVKFQIEINDPASNAQNGPDLQRIEFKASALSAERLVLNGAPGVDCERRGRFIEGTRWSFNCSFDSNHIANVKNHLNSGLTGEAVFFASATSKRNGKSTGAIPAQIKVEFPKVETTSTQSPAAPAFQPSEDERQGDQAEQIPLPPPRPRDLTRPQQQQRQQAPARNTRPQTQRTRTGAQS